MPIRFSTNVTNLQSCLQLVVCTFWWLGKLPVVRGCHFLLQLYQYVFHGELPLPICQHSKLLCFNLLPITQQIKQRESNTTPEQEIGKWEREISERCLINHCNKMEPMTDSRKLSPNNNLHFSNETETESSYSRGHSRRTAFLILMTDNHTNLKSHV